MIYYSKPILTHCIYDMLEIAYCMKLETYHGTPDLYA
jgi:hypothetical protein